MAGLTQTLIAKVSELTLKVNSILTKAKQFDDLPVATLPLAITDVVAVSQGGVLKRTTKEQMAAAAAVWGSLTGTITTQTDLMALFLNVERFEATDGQVSHIVAAGAIVDNGLWSVQVGSELWNSTSGITSFTEGLISINFATGQITFLEALDLGTQVIIKYN